MPVDPNVTALDGTPGSISIATTELVPLGFDFKANIGPSESLANPGSIMVDLSNGGASVVLTDMPSLGVGAYSTMVIQEVRGAELVPTHKFRLIVSADIVGVSAAKRLSVSVLISVPY